MASKSATITTAAGETDQVVFPAGTGSIEVTGTISAGAIQLVVRQEDSAAEYVWDTIDATTLQTNGNEAGDGYSWGERIEVPKNAQVLLVANAAFSGSVTARVTADPF
jgi:hypothetical protein